MQPYTRHFNTKETPQTEAIPGKPMSKNNAGGYSFALDKWASLNRFLILGTEGGTYYVAEKELTVLNAKNVIACIQEDGLAVVDAIVAVSEAGKAPKNDAAIFALALVTANGTPEAKAKAYAAIPRVCRIGTHLFQMCESIQSLRGWSRGLRKGVARFYTERSAADLAYQLIKYQQRNGWTHRDVLRLTHPTPTTPAMNDLFRYAVGKGRRPSSEANMPQLAAFEELKALGTTDLRRSVRLIQDFNLPREAVPTELLNQVDIWEVLLETMPITAMIRNLGKMTSVGLLVSNLDASTKHVVATLTNKDILKKGRVHPLGLLMALMTYKQGKGVKGSLTWNPVPNIVDALQDAFYLSFDTIEPTGLNFLYGLDVSGSMGYSNVGSFITCREAAAALAMTLARTEPNHEIMCFSDEFIPFPISKSERLDAVVKRMNGMSFGATDCALPMVYAQTQKRHVDTFVVITDSETYCGTPHPSQALVNYRYASGVPSKLVVLGMTSNNFTIADPSDRGMLDVCGLDPSVPEIISTFAKE